jgi:hypothetical protein
MLDELAPRLKYIVVALGCDWEIYNTTADLERYFTRMRNIQGPQLSVNICTASYVAKTGGNIRFVDSKQELYTGEILLRHNLDKVAGLVNLNYVENVDRKKADPVAEWNKLGYFSRESCRASADFIPAMLGMAGLSTEDAANAEVFEKQIPRGSALLESLAITEHLRWNAFHFAMGYTAMSIEEVRCRDAEGIKPIQKDTVKLSHACLILWDDLDLLSAVVSELTGKEVDYKEYDRVNIYQISKTLRFGNEARS